MTTGRTVFRYSCGARARNANEAARRMEGGIACEVIYLRFFFEFVLLSSKLVQIVSSGPASGLG
jgi:hypothetical protein